MRYERIRSLSGPLLWSSLVALSVVLAAMLYWTFQRLSPSGLDADATPRGVTPRGDLGADEKATIAIFRQAAPAVVHITSLVNVAEDMFSLNVQQVPEGTGSGFVWDQAGHVVTNYHVIRSADAAQVVLADRSTWKARLVGAYPEGDLAVLVIDAPADRLHPVLVGSSHDLQVGQRVFAIGNPFGLDHTLTTGIVSALGREITAQGGRPIKGMIQIDAAINPGNSGGPLLDSAGRLIGVNSAIISPSGAFSGVGFAIPVDTVNRVVTELIRHGKVQRPSLGIQPAPDQWLEDLGLKGVLVLDVRPGSPAAKAGIRPTRRMPGGDILLGDLIVGLDEHPVASAEDLYAAQEAHQIGDQVTVKLLRRGQTKEVVVTLGASQ
jgi:S1-C subfamily serine protease